MCCSLCSLCALPVKFQPLFSLFSLPLSTASRKIVPRTSLWLRFTLLFSLALLLLFDVLQSVKPFSLQVGVLDGVSVCSQVRGRRFPLCASAKGSTRGGLSVRFS